MEESHLLATTAVDGEDVWIENIHSCPDKKTPPDGLDQIQRAEKAPTSKWEDFLRAIGPRILPAWMMSRSGRQEPRKVAIQHGFLYALLGALIHIIPVFGVVFIVVLNLRGCLFAIVRNYSDLSSEWIPALQFAAKLHDLFMLASLTSFVFSVMSSELCLRKGLPYGAIFSGLQVSHPSFLWSQEMWGMLTSDELPKLVIMKMGLTVLGAVLLGLAVGPASAALMIPRVRTTHVGSTPFWLNATESSLFPDLLDGSVVQSSCANVTGQIDLNACPSSGWEELAGFVSVPGPPIVDPDSRDSWLQGLIDTYSQEDVIELSGIYTNTKRSMYKTGGSMISANNWYDSEVVTTQNAVLAEALFAVAQMWKQITQYSRMAYKADTSFHTLNASQPYAAVHCYDYAIEGKSDVRPIPFQDDNGDTYNLTTMNRSELLQPDSGVNMPRLRFVDLSKLNSSVDDLKDVSLGGLILNGDQGFSSCVIHSGWASSYLNISTESTDNTGSTESARDIHNLSLRNVKISPSWANFLNPIADPSGARVFDMLSTRPAGLTDDFDGFGVFYEPFLAAMVANGLANIGIGTIFRGNVTDPVRCRGDDPGVPHCDHSQHQHSPIYSADPAYFVQPSDAEAEALDQWQVNHFVHGLAYSSDGFVVKVSIVVLLIYATVASVHSVYTIVRGQGSSCWQSVSELTTLALVSQPPQDPNLQNTAAGIYGLGAFKKNVRIVAVDGEKAAQKCREELQLVFGKKMPAGFKKLEPNEEYGATH